MRREIFLMLCLLILVTSVFAFYNSPSRYQAIYDHKEDRLYLLDTISGKLYTKYKYLEGFKWVPDTWGPSEQVGQ